MSVILHIDLDAFFAAVEQRDNPALAGKPVVVGADPQAGKGRGVVSTCSYEARKFGIHSAMPISTAYKLCPGAVFLPCDFQKYSQVSRQVFAILNDFTPDVEPISIDEAFLDITGSFHLFKTPYETGLRLKERIQKEVRLTASVGIAPIKMAAKIASDISKPDGLLEIKPEGLLDFLWPLRIERLWGVGPKTQEALNKSGIKTIGELAKTSREMLEKYFGEAGLHLHNLANGIDPRQVAADDSIKSVGHEHTFDIDTNDVKEIEKVLLSLSEQVSRRLRQDGLKGRTLTVKIRLEGFQTFTRAHTFSQKTNHVDVIYQQAREIFAGFERKGKRVRLLGVRMTHFEDPYMAESLFADPSADKRENIHKAVDVIKDKFGEKAIRRAA